MDDLLKGSVLISKSSKENALEYDHIAKHIDSRDNLQFLSDIVPQRILFSKAIKIYNQMNKKKEEEKEATATPALQNDSNTNDKMEIDE